VPRTKPPPGILFADKLSVPAAIVIFPYDVPPPVPPYTADVYILATYDSTNLAVPVPMALFVPFGVMRFPDIERFVVDDEPKFMVLDV